MGHRIKLASWLRSSSSSTTSDAERKKQNRRSFSAFSSVPAWKSSKDELVNGKESKAAPVSEETKTETIETPAVESASKMIALAKKISAEAEKLETYMKANGLPIPSFEVDSPGDFPKLPEDIQKSRQEIVYATKELGNLVRGPREGIRWGTWSVSLDEPPLLLEIGS
jgi:hypothetical protein